MTEPKELEIGYVCDRGHFQFHGDPTGDMCGTKRMAGVYVREDEVGAYTVQDIEETTAESLESLHRKIEVWRKS